jgi:transposase
MADPIFKPYDPNQPTFLPPSLDELLGEDHPVRFINRVIDQMDITSIIRTYEGGGTSSYHPAMMLKVIIYGYVQRIHSCRKIAQAVRESIPFMWLAGGQRPDFRTINNFRKQRLPEGGIKAIFTQVVTTLVELGLVDLSEYTVDGTTLEANARRHSAVWRKNAERYRQGVIDRIEAYFDQIQQLADLEAEQWQDGVTDGQPGWTSQQLEEVVERIDQALSEREREDEDQHAPPSDSGNEPPQPTGKQLSMARTRLRWIRDKEVPKLAKYEAQLQRMGERNSYSTTDPDATFMRMKDQSPFDKLLAAGYNLQMGAQNQYVLGYSIHSNAADKVNLEEHLNQLAFTPKWLCADGGYNSLHIYQMLEEEGITAVIKAPGYRRPRSPYHRYAMQREPQTDSYRCPQGRAMRFKKTSTYRYGPEQRRSTRLRIYECEDCSGCPVRSQCTRSEGNRTIQFVPALESYKEQMSRRGSQGKGKRLSRNRGVNIESVFGMLKHNDGLRRLSMRGRRMVQTEIGLKAIAYNLRRMCSEIRTTFQQQFAGMLAIAG